MLYAVMLFAGIVIGFVAGAVVGHYLNEFKDPF